MYHIPASKRLLFYGLFGASCALLDLLIFSLLLKTTPALYANAIGYTSGTSASYLLNKTFTFKSSSSRLSKMRFGTVAAIGLLTSQLIIFLGGLFLQTDQQLELLKSASILVVAALQFLLNNKFGSKTINNQHGN